MKLEYREIDLSKRETRIGEKVDIEHSHCIREWLVYHGTEYLAKIIIDYAIDNWEILMTAEVVDYQRKSMERFCQKQLAERKVGK